MSKARRFDPPVITAEALAHAAHAGQTRKDGVTPYVTHAKDVAGILRRYGARPHVIDAGWLHDVIEDVLPVTSAVLALFVRDLRTHKIVCDVTNFYTAERFTAAMGWNRARRKAAEAVRLGSHERDSRTVKAADILSNLTSQGGIVSATGEKFARVWLAEKRVTIAAITSPGGIPPGLVEAVRVSHAREESKI